MRSSLFDTQGEVSLLLPDGRAGYCNFKQVKALREGGMVGVFPGAFLIAG
ncbi:hypothetical protein PA15_0307175 [Pseudomonas aeruginosa HB15]|jgi:hypothetical protein|nr:hypothetical protein PA15_0307175 [Pseudomonas aeruginosa HB15]